MQGRLPAVRLWNFYGQTEIAPLATVLKPEDQLRKAGSAGKPVLNVETRVVNPAMAGNVTEGRRVRDSLNPVRAAIRKTKPPGKPYAHQKYWQELLGQVGGPVRRPLVELTEAEKAATREAFETWSDRRTRDCQISRSYSPPDARRWSRRGG